MTIRSKVGALLGAGLLTFVVVGMVSASGTSVTLCHATPPDTAANGWIEITTDTSSDGTLKGGHDTSHDADIIPAYHDVSSGFDYPGKNLNTLFDGVLGSVILANHCVSARSSTPPSNPPSENASFSISGEPATNQPHTDTAFGSTGSSGPTDTAWLLVVALGVLLASIVVLTPARAKGKR